MKKLIFFCLSIAAVSSLLLISLANASGNGNQSAIKATTYTTVFIHDIDDTQTGTAISADNIQWFEGEAADEQFAKHETDAGSTVSPDGYYIVNESSDLTTLKINPNVQILMQIFDQPEQSGEADIIPDQAISLQQFKALFAQEDGLNMRDYPFHLTIQKGEITKIIQQYIP